MSSLDLWKARDVVLSQLERTVGWVDDEEIKYLRDHPEDDLHEITIDTAFDFGALLTALESCVRPGPPYALDRDALVAIIGGHWFPQYTDAERADAVLALLRPVEGVVLTREEAASVAMALRYTVALNEDGERLVARLEAAP